MFDKSYVTVDPSDLLNLLADDFQRLEDSVQPAYEDCIDYWLPKMKRRSWFGFVGPYWKEGRRPTIDEVDAFVKHQDCDWGIDHDFRAKKSIERRYKHFKADILKLQKVAIQAAEQKQPMYMKVNEYHMLLNTNLYNLWVF